MNRPSAATKDYVHTTKQHTKLLRSNINRNILHYRAVGISVLGSSYAKARVQHELAETIPLIEKEIAELKELGRQVHAEYGRNPYSYQIKEWRRTANLATRYLLEVSVRDNNQTN